jgi:C1A family cysteine protease
MNPLDGEPILGAHSMCFVGYEDDETDTALGGGKFYVRNSWENWASESTIGASGYGTISYSYISRFGAEAYCIDLL